MIEFRNVSKRYISKLGAAPWVLKDINLIFPDNRNVGVIGPRGSGKNTFFNLLSGMDKPTRGSIIRGGRVSWPIGKGAGLLANLTGRQNANFVCRLQCHDDKDHHERLAFIEKFSELGPAFNEPVRTYSGTMKMQLQITLSLTFEFDTYIAKGTAAGVGDFRKKVIARFVEQTSKGNLILASNNAVQLRRHCQSCVLIHKGSAIWYEDLEEGLLRFNEIEKALGKTLADESNEMNDEND